MGFFGTVGKGLKKAGKGLSKAAHEYDDYLQKNKKEQMHRMQDDLKFQKLKTQTLAEKEKQKKYKTGPFDW